MRNRRLAKRISASVVMAVAAALLAGSLSPMSAAAALPDLPGIAAVKGAPAAALAALATPKSSASVLPVQTSVVSGASTITTPVNEKTIDVRTERADGSAGDFIVGEWQAAPGGQIAVASASHRDFGLTAPRMAKPVESVSVQVLDAAQTAKAGMSGLVIILTRADGAGVEGPVGVRVPIALIDGLYGADYASRAQWQTVTGDASGSKAKSTSTPVPSTVDFTTADLILSPQVGTQSVMLMSAAGATSSSGTGDYAATPLAPSSSWDVSAQTGGFSWAYPLRVPPPAAGPSPSVAFNYSSQSVDGEGASTNNQPSAVGEGWTLAGGGFIERSYVSCSGDDGASGPVTTSGDQCWKLDNATISVGGHSGTLVKSTGNLWKLESDDGSRIEHLVGTSQGCAANSNGTWDNDCWRMTTTDGTQYYFGLGQLPGWSTGKPLTNSAWTLPVFGNDVGEPCHASTFATSSCAQAWRWNLDYVVDVHGNAQSLYYHAETNKYALNGTTATSYVRGGQLDRIEYGFKAGTAYSTNAASGKVTFGYSSYGRCSDTTGVNCTTETISAPAVAAAHPTFYPDVPFDQLCTAAPCTGKLSPTFWTTGMLNTVTTQVLKSGAYTNVDSWALGHSFPDPGDGTTAALWLTQVTHTGYAGGTTLAEPATVFTGAAMQNRVWVVDGLAPMDKYRITSIQTQLGALISVNYAAPDCTPANAAATLASPESNTKRCYPQWWSPQVTPPQASQQDLFHKYVVASLIVDPRTGGARDSATETYYDYTGLPGWRYNNSPLTPADRRTWSIFAGYDRVDIRVGSPADPSKQQVTEFTFFQGLDGDRATASGGTKTVVVSGSGTVADSPWFAGQVWKSSIRNGVGGAIISESITSPWSSAPTADDTYNKSRYIRVGSSTTSEPLASGGQRTVTTTSTFDANGLTLSTGVAHSDAGAQCTTISYAPQNSTMWLVGLPNLISEVAVDCGSLATANYAQKSISATRITYDGLAYGATPLKGDSTKTELVDYYTGTAFSSAHWFASLQSTYDVMGRTVLATDALGLTMSTVYTPSALAATGSGALTSKVVTNTAPYNWASTSTFDPAWGELTSLTDANGKITSVTYDALGRRVGVWFPGRAKATNPQPSVGYAYALSTTAASSVTTNTVGPNGIVTSIDLIDGLGRAVQSQSPAEGGGAVVSDIAYDSWGRTSATNAAYWTTTPPSTSLFVPSSQSAVPSYVTVAYDGAGRATSQAQWSYGVEKFHSSFDFVGADRVDTTPPAGGTPTTSFTNSMGQVTSMKEYLAATPTSSAVSELTTYAYTPQGQMSTMTDPAGNVWTWAYDTLGHQTSSTDPDTGTTVSTYDVSGNLLSRTDSRGVTLAYKYDSLNRMTAEYKDATTSAGSLLASWTYDTLAKGQLTESRSYVGSTPGTPGAAYVQTIAGYTDSYLPTGSTTTIPASAPAFAGTSYGNTYTYGPDGSLATQVDPAIGGLPAETLRLTYTATGRLSALRGSVQVAAVTYTPIGLVSQISRPGTNGLNTAYGYDPATGAISQVRDAKVVGTTSTILADRTYQRDSAGNVTSISTAAAGVATDTQCFAYDALRVLTQAWTPTDNSCANAPSSSNIGGPAPYWTSYVVDPATGNRTQTTDQPITASGSPTTHDYSYPSATSSRPHSVQTVTHTVGGVATTDTYAYDNAGNTTTRLGQNLSYDALGKLSSATAPGGTQTTIYDAAGVLLLQIDETGATLYLGDTEVHKNPGATASSGIRTYSVGGGPIAERSTVAGVAGSVLTYIGTDPQHTATVRLDVATGTVTRRYTGPYGGTRGTAVPWSSLHGFLNGPTSGVTGLVQLGARQYDPTIGKFTTVDGVLAPLSPRQNNGYSYAGNSPITASDSNGLCPTPTGACPVNPWSIFQVHPPFYVPPSVSPCVGNSCVHQSSPSIQKVADAVDKKADKLVEPQDGCDALDRMLNGSMGCDQDGVTAGDELLADYLRSPGGHIVGGWLFGLAPKVTFYGPETELTQGVRENTEFLSRFHKVMNMVLDDGITDFSMSDLYDFGPIVSADGLSDHVVPDALTVLSPSTASLGDHMKVALGSYTITATIMSVDTTNRTAVIAYSGINNSTLGSASGSESQDARNTLNNLIPSTGPMSKTTQIWGWSEVMNY